MACRLFLVACLLALLLPAGTSASGKRRVVSYSLFGIDEGGTTTNVKYVRGILQNIALIQAVLPDWDIWVYVSNSLNASMVAPLHDFSRVRVIHKPFDPARWTEATMWRFLPEDDPDVDVFMSRDTDARVWSRDVHTIKSFLASDSSVLTIHDHFKHELPMLAGMWGARRGHITMATGKSMEALLKDYCGRSDVDLARKGTDQFFLRDVVWPQVKALTLSYRNPRNTVEEYCNGAAQCLVMPPAWDSVISPSPHFDFVGRTASPHETYICAPNPNHCSRAVGLTAYQAWNITKYITS